MDAAGDGERHAGKTKLLTKVEPVHRGAGFQAGLGDVHHERLTPVGFGDIEPELGEGVVPRRGRFGRRPQPAKIPGVLHRAEKGEANCEGDHARPQGIAWTREPLCEKKCGKRWSQQNQAQVVAKSQRVDAVEHRQPHRRLLLRPCEQSQQGRPDDQKVERVDLSDDGLGPEGVRKREQEARREPSHPRVRHPHCEERGDSDGNRSVDRRREVQRPRRLAGMHQHEQAAEPVVERVGLPGRQIERADAGLERRAVSELQARQNRRVVAGKRDKRRSGRNQPFREPGSGGAERGASLVSMGKLAASHSGTPPFSTRTLMPRFWSSPATRVLTSSFGSESYT